MDVHHLIERRKKRRMKRMKKIFYLQKWVFEVALGSLNFYVVVAAVLPLYHHTSHLPEILKHPSIDLSLSNLVGKTHSVL